MEKAYIFLAEGFEEIEALTVVDIFRRAGIQISMVSVSGNETVTGSHAISVKADVLFDRADFSDGTLFILPGGKPGSDNLRSHDGLKRLFREKEADGRKIAAICAAPTVLASFGVLEGKKATCYPGLENQLAGAVWTEGVIVTDGNTTTSRGMGTAIDFALCLVSQILGRETADQLAGSIVYNVF